MVEGTTPQGCAVQHSTAHASLAALGVHLQQLDLFGPIREEVHIAQKTVRYSPADKLYDAFIALLAGAQGLVEINGGCAPIRPCKPPSGAAAAPSNRWCKRPWMPAPRRRSSRWKQLGP